MEDSIFYYRIGAQRKYERPRGVVQEIQEELKERKIRCEIDKLPDLLGAQSLLRLVIVNLVSNAVKFTSTRPQAGIKIGCEDEDDKLTCSVTDKGV
jgi:signal transduction histidine kinase